VAERQPARLAPQGQPESVRRAASVAYGPPAAWWVACRREASRQPAACPVALRDAPQDESAGRPRVALRFVASPLAAAGPAASATPWAVLSARPSGLPSAVLWEPPLEALAEEAGARPLEAQAGEVAARPLEAPAEEVAAGEAAAQPSEAPAAAVARLSAARAAEVVRPSALQAAVAARPSAVASPSPSLPFPSPSVPRRLVRTAHVMRWRRTASQSEWSWQAAPSVVFSWRSRFPGSCLKKRGDQQTRVRPDCGGIQRQILHLFRNAQRARGTLFIVHSGHGSAEMQECIAARLAGLGIAVDEHVGDAVILPLVARQMFDDDSARP